MNKKLPQHLLAIVGCAKSGSSALAAYLGSRPDMVLGKIKEPRYFTHMAGIIWSGPGSVGFQETILSNPEDYADNFCGLRDEQWAIDASTDYIWRSETPELLHEFAQNREVRIICIIRDPIDRAISEYNHTLRNGWETLPFQAALDAEQCRIRDHWIPLFYHRRRSMVSEDLDRFRGVFGTNLMIINYTELGDFHALTQRINRFLGLTYEPAGKIETRNESYLPRNNLAARVLRGNNIRAISRMLVPGGLRRRIRESFLTNARNIETVSQTEVARFRELMRDEIARCRDNPLIEVDSWSLAMAGAPSAMLTNGRVRGGSM